MNENLRGVAALGVGLAVGVGPRCWADEARGFSGLPYMLELSIDAESWDALGDPSNAVLSFNLSEMLIPDSMLIMNITAVEWDLTIETLGSSWLSEVSLAMRSVGDAGAPTVITPGLGLDFPGQSDVTSGGLVELSASEIVLLPTGVLEIEFFETFDDANDAVDALVSGTITLHGHAIPAPGVLCSTLALSVLGARRRRGPRSG